MGSSPTQAKINATTRTGRKEYPEQKRKKAMGGSGRFCCPKIREKVVVVVIAAKKSWDRFV